MNNACRPASTRRSSILLATLILVLAALACLAGCSCQREAEIWTVTFEDDGEAIKTVDVEASDEGVLVDCPVLDSSDGATFQGWTSDDPESLVVVNPPRGKHDTWTVRVFGDGAHVSPVWQGVYTVTFTDGNGTELGVYTVNDGDPLPKVDDPKREGYEFAGWDANPEAVHENLTINATWKEAKTWTITYMDGQGNVLQTFKVSDGEAVPAADKPTRDGYEFAGWDSAPQNAYKDLTINAKWTKIWTVTYTDGEGKTIETFKVKDGDALPTIDAPKRDGYTFDGWDTDATTVTKDLTINAKWKKDVTWKVVFTDGNGNVLSEQTVADGKDAKEPEEPTREGYEFDGWDGSFTKVTKDLTINAKWKAVETEGMKDALRAAKRYLDDTPFSHDGLVWQLEYDGYTHDEAVYAADKCGADWNKQAEAAAKRYLDMMPMSRSDLIYQLEYDGFTHEQAVHGADSAGL